MEPRVVEIEVEKKPEESMYVKVNVEGCPIGRKINLKAHNSYESLTCALHKLFKNFFSVNYLDNQEDVEEQDGEKDMQKPELVLIYEDNEGHKLLISDVPWEVFISSVKRILIKEA